MDDTSRRVGNSESIAGRGDEDVRGRSNADEQDEDVTRRTREIRHDIEQTREELSETVEAIQEKLRPRNIVAGATQRVKTATTERVREMVDNAGEAAQDAASYARERLEGTYDSVRTNPIPAAMIGIGAAWLLMQRSGGNRGYRQNANSRSYTGGETSRDYTARDYPYRAGNPSWSNASEESGFFHRVRNNPIPAALATIGLSWLAFSDGEGDREVGRDRYAGSYGAYGTDRYRRAPRSGDESTTEGESLVDRAKESAEYLQDRAQQVQGRAQEYVEESRVAVRRVSRRAQTQLQRMMEDNPLLVGAGALMIGAAFGLAVPETDRENELMGDARDSVVERAQSLARDAATNVQNAAGTAVVDAAKKTLTGEQS